MNQAASSSSAAVALFSPSLLLFAAKIIFVFCGAVVIHAAENHHHHHLTTTTSNKKKKINNKYNNNNNNNNNNRTKTAGEVVDLPFGDINVVVLTDVHSWVGGHGHHELYDVDYGDVLSFYERLKDHCDASDKDLFFVMNGDWIDGTGLSLNGDVSHLVPIIEKMPYDLVNVGNHELFRSSVIEYMSRPGGLIEWFGEKYLTSNVIWNTTTASTTTTTVKEKEEEEEDDDDSNDDDDDGDNNTNERKPLGHRYRVLRGKYCSLLSFGFLYNMVNQDPIVAVEKVQDATDSAWFRNAILGESYDAILVLAHMDAKDPLVYRITSKIRNLTLGSNKQNTPIQFIAGHSHHRGYTSIDGYATSFEAGRYLDTIGFVSFPKRNTITKENQSKTIDDDRGGEEESESSSRSGNGSSETSILKKSYDHASLRRRRRQQQQILFRHEFLEANKNTLRKTLGLSPAEQLDTPNGIELKRFIARVQNDLGLEEITGCSPKRYYLNASLASPNSLWGLFQRTIAPKILREARENAKPNNAKRFHEQQLPVEQQQQNKTSMLDHHVESSATVPTEPESSTTTTTISTTFDDGDDDNNNNNNRADHEYALILDCGDFRYDLLDGHIRVDDVIAVAPYNKSLYSISPNISGNLLLELYLALNNGGKGGCYMNKEIPTFVLSLSTTTFHDYDDNDDKDDDDDNNKKDDKTDDIIDVSGTTKYNLLTGEGELSHITKILSNITNNNNGGGGGDTLATKNIKTKKRRKNRQLLLRQSSQQTTTTETKSTPPARNHLVADPTTTKKGKALLQIANNNDATNQNDRDRRDAAPFVSSSIVAAKEEAVAAADGGGDNNDDDNSAAKEEGGCGDDGLFFLDVQRMDDRTMTDNIDISTTTNLILSFMREFWSCNMNNDS